MKTHYDYMVKAVTTCLMKEKINWFEIDAFVMYYHENPKVFECPNKH